MGISFSGNMQDLASECSEEPETWFWEKFKQEGLQRAHPT